MTDTKTVARQVDEQTILLIAQDIARDLIPIQQVLETHNLTQKEFENIQNHPIFQRALEAELVVWNAATNTEERLRMKMALMSEQFLPELWNLIVSPTENLNHKIEAFKLLLNGAGVSKPEVAGPAAGPGVSIKIDIGAGQDVKIGKTIEHKTIEGDSFGS